MSKLQRNDNQIKTEYVLRNQLPSFAAYYFRSNRGIMADSSLYAYALEIASFFDYMHQIKGIPVKDISIRDFEAITEAEIENYIEYLKVFTLNGVEKTRSVYSLRRKFATLHSFYVFYYSEGMIDNLPSLRINRPKKVAKAPNILSDDMIMELIEYITKGKLPSDRATAHQEHYRERDAAIITLLSYAGLKPSECLNLNIDDLHLEDNYIYIKGRKYPCVTISSDVILALSAYLSVRFEIIPNYGDDKALFLTERGTRMCARAMQVMIKKYTTALFGNDCKITARDLCFTHKSKVFSNTRNIGTTAMTTGFAPNGIVRTFYADISEKLSDLI